MKDEAELEGCTFHPQIKEPVLPNASYVPGEERHHHLQSYLGGESYGGETESMLNNAVDSVNYVNNL